MPIRVGSNPILKMYVGPNIQPWSPANLTNVLYWWYTGAGISASSNEVQSWTDQISGRVLSKLAGTGMTYDPIDSQFNNLASVYQDGTMATVSNNTLSDIGGSDVFTQIWIGKPEVIGSATYSFWGGETSTGLAASEVAPYISSPDSADVPGTYRFGYDGSGRLNTTAVTNDGSLAYHIVAVDTPNGTITQYWNSTTANTVSSLSFSSADRIPFRWEIGGYDNSSGSKFKGYIFESIVMTALPTAQELSDLDAYVTGRYS